MEAKDLMTLKQFFQVSIAGFNFLESVLKTIDQPINWKAIEMKKLHQDALALLEKTDLLDAESAKETRTLLINFIGKMEILASQPKELPRFPEGGKK